MNTSPAPDRCRIVLIAPGDAEPDFAARLGRAIKGGDVASLILPPGGRNEVSYQRFAEAVVPTAQAAGIAAVMVGDTRLAGRVGADGIHVEGGKAALADTMAKFHPRIMVGAGGANTRDEALELGEERPDYVFFGRFGYDIGPEPHPRNLSLGAWWAEMIEIPAIVLGGSDISSAATVAATGAEFVALSAAVFGHGIDPEAAIAAANRLLDERAPRFETPQ